MADETIEMRRDDISRGAISTFSIDGRSMARDILERFMDALSCIDQGALLCFTEHLQEAF